MKINQILMYFIYYIVEIIMGCWNVPCWVILNINMFPCNTKLRDTIWSNVIFYIFRDNFLREVEILAGLKDPNIASVIGVSTQAEPMLMIMEYSKHGDLCQFLRQCNARNDSPVNDESIIR